ncbi:MAG: radical SAM family heme chaperone HemW [Acidobacteriaceae bacterium]
MKILKHTSARPSKELSASDSLGIYISIPFCRAKCSYCNFASGVFGSERMLRYVDRLTTEIRSTRPRAEKWSASVSKTIDSIYFGGGTPSLLNQLQMRQILQAIQEEFSFSCPAEITLECAPGQLGDELLEALPALGFNRVSLGVQTFVDREAKAVGRLHTRAIALQEIARLRNVGIQNINVDLIAGLPHQTSESWQASLEQAIDTGVPHLSVYMLDVDEDSRLGREMLAGGTRYGVGMVPNAETIAAMYNEACEQFPSAGIAQYEISNFAQPGYKSSHNLKYWKRQPYLGFGLDAHSFLPTLDGTAIRVGTTDDLTAYLNHGAQETITRVSTAEAIEEAWFLGLRLSAGISLAEMEREIGPAAMSAFRPVLLECEDRELLEVRGGNVCLTQRGRLFANEVFAGFLGVLDSEPEMNKQGALA